MDVGCCISVEYVVSDDTGMLEVIVGATYVSDVVPDGEDVGALPSEVVPTDGQHASLVEPYDGGPHSVATGSSDDSVTPGVVYPGGVGPAPLQVYKSVQVP